MKKITILFILILFCSFLTKGQKKGLESLTYDPPQYECQMIVFTDGNETIEY